ncbi:FAD/NAD(P)-binding protein [Brachybacterium sp. EF45031]|uniref:FAD/NAD(P)-binding protein n=1 Tax=Brachybacterium sillae TaxID=2810536 RepID=UPI00217E44B8|nr:FAD/NAD(P)-binding protein [Brachybacterium sillae]MCS6711750.1 FAD/NAD(P)-binding protein [Brachybacterium sillae]
MNQPPHSPRPLHLVVVGGGPKALFALEDLASALHRPPHAADGRDVPAETSRSETPDSGTAAETVAVSGAESVSASVRVTVVDPGRTLGPGAAYDPEQPEVLRLNVAAPILDAPPPLPGVADLPDLPTWLTEHAPEHAGESFPPRAIVGRYLEQRWERLRTALPIEHVQGRASEVRSAGSTTETPRWTVRLAGSEDLSGTELCADELVIATGHAPDHAGALHHTWQATAPDGRPLPLVPAVLPATRFLTTEAVPPGSRVAVRGGALTFIDAALVLFRARPLHEAPTVLIPITRDGLFLDAKPPADVPLIEPVAAALATGRRQLEDRLDADDARGGTDRRLALSELLSHVARTAAAVLAVYQLRADERSSAVSGRVVSGGSVSAQIATTLLQGCEPDLPTGAGRAREALRRSVEVAEGRRTPGPAWALGRAWSALYSLVVRAVSRSEEPEEAWAAFHRSAAVLERFAFGPPPSNARILLDLIDAGAVDTSWMDAKVRIDAEGLHGLPTGAVVPDVVIDAVLPPPGVPRGGDPLLLDLLDRGVLSRAPGRRGVRTTRAGTALTSDDTEAVGLAVLGRPTEDWSLGQDSLNRHLHPESRAWAQRVATRLRGTGTSDSPDGRIRR